MKTVPNGETMHRAISLFLLLTCITTTIAEDWSQWLGSQRDSVWRETGIVDSFPEDGPPVLWRTPIGAGYAGPAVTSDRVYVMDRQLATGAKNPKNAFKRGSIAGNERLLCLNAKDGEIVWKHEYDCPYTVSYPSGPRATPVVSDGRVYALGAEGYLFCRDAATGDEVWSRQLKEEYEINSPVWGFSASPLLDGDRLICIVGGKDSLVVAFNKDTGKEIWSNLSSIEPGYCPPMIFGAGGTRQLIIWHPQSINGLNPETGELYWSQKFEVRSGLTIPTPRKSDDMLFVTSFYNGPMMLKLDDSKPAASLAWKGNSNSEKRTDKLHSIMCTPFIEDGYIYGVGSYGQLRCLEAATGKRIWEDLKATGSTGSVRSRTDRWANAFLVKHEDKFFLANEKGDLIIARLTPKGYEEISRAHLIEPTDPMAGRDVVWSHPAFANKRVYMRNDKEIICVDLANK